jgi:hypothetical protein
LRRTFPKVFHPNVADLTLSLLTGRRSVHRGLEWNDAIAKYLAADEESCDACNIFAKLNAIRCEFAIRNGHDSYVALSDDGSKKNVHVKWQFFEVEGLRRPVSKHSE